MSELNAYEHSHFGVARINIAGTCVLTATIIEGFPRLNVAPDIASQMNEDSSKNLRCRDKPRDKPGDNRACRPILNGLAGAQVGTRKQPGPAMIPSDQYTLFRTCLPAIDGMTPS